MTSNLGSSSKISLQVSVFRRKCHGDCAFSVTDRCLWKMCRKGLKLQHIFLRLLFNIYNIFFVSFGLKCFIAQRL